MVKGKNIVKCGVSAVFSAVIAVGTLSPTLIQLAPLTANAGEQLGQTDFDDGVGLPWHICESAPGEMDFEIDKGVYKVTIVNPGGASAGGEDRWDCQFRHRGLKIVAGHEYEVKYEITASTSGKYYTKIGNLDGDVEIWHNMSNGSDLDSTWDPLQINANETKKIDLKFTASQSLDVAEWAFHLGGDGQYTPGGCFPAGTVITFDNMSLVDLTSDENDYVAPEEWERAGVLTNQVGYFVGREKKATLLSKKKQDFDILDENGNSVYSGTSIDFGHDDDSDDDVQVLDFSDFDDEGTFTIETEDGSTSREFVIGDSSAYSEMLYDSLNYFYQNRSGIEIESKYITSGDANALARAAGHDPDNAEIEQTWGYSGSSGTIDVTGGWYDAGDHGKYVVNGGFSLWLMQNQYEVAKKYGFEDVYADGTMNIPENNNSYPDLLDEARWEMDWMFSMIVDSGDYEGMLYHKAHDEKWTALGIAPADDEMKRIVKPPTTAATLNFAACAAQAARLWEGIDDDFSEKCLDAAETAYEAAKKHPDMYAPLDESVGGGAYGDDDVTDEFYWAACELYITTGDASYHDDMKDSDFFLELPTKLGGGESVDTVGSFDWGNTAALGTMSISISDTEDSEKASDNIISASDHYIEIEDGQGYGQPYGPSTLSYNDKDKGYLWGSNSFVTDNSIVMAYGYLLSDDTQYLDGALGGLDYILGRNPMDYSYVTGYGTHAIEYPHHRYWAKQIDDAFPMAPSGVMSGGPNSGMQDPWVQGSGWKKGEIPPAKCYLDNIEAWSVNECTINWNTSLAWLTAFAAQENGGIMPDEVNLSTDTSPTDSDSDDDSDTEEKMTKKSSSSTKKATATKAASKNDDNDSDKGDKKSSNLGLIAIIAGACLLGLGSIEVLIFKIFKMKNNNSKK